MTKRLSWGANFTGSLAPLPLDSGRYVSIIEPEHTRIHEQRAFTCSNKHSVSAGSAYTLLLINSATDFGIHFRNYSFSVQNAPGDIYLYEASSATAVGSSLADCVKNNWRPSSNASHLQVTEFPTIASDGTQIEYSFIPGNKQIGGSAQSYSNEWGLQRNKYYLIKYVNTSGQASTVGHHLFWYEVLL